MLLTETLVAAEDKNWQSPELWHKTLEDVFSIWSLVQLNGIGMTPDE